MKKTLALALSLVLVLACAITMISCDDVDMSEVAGTYKMTDISGSITSGGQTIELSPSLYDYYTIELKEDGVAVVSAKGVGGALSDEGTWSYSNGVISLKTKTGGVTVVEEMDWDDGTITFVSEQSDANMSVKMNMTLVRED